MRKLSYIEISKKKLIHNFNLFRSFINSDTKIACVVKSNAYGHGQNEVVDLLDPLADYFQVDDLLELVSLRKISKKPTFVFGYVAKDELEEALKLDGILAVYDLERLEFINKISKELGKKALVHVKVDANLGRQGILLDQVEEYVRNLKQFEFIEVDGVYSHFANIEDTTDFTHAQKQIDTYDQAVKIFEANGFSNIKRHISATSGILAYEKNEGKNDIVRLGIGLYGMWPSEELKSSYQKPEFDLQPVICWVTHVAQIKELPANYSIGYGLTYTTSKPMKIAIIPQGYGDGFDRGFSNKGRVLIGGKKCDILGRVAMNMFVVDVTSVGDIKVEDEVVLLGSQGNEYISAEELAKILDTINYEITTCISPLLPRIILE